MSFVRDHNDGESYAVVGLAIGGDRITVFGGSITFHVKGNSAGVNVLNGPGKIGAEGVFLR